MSQQPWRARAPSAARWSRERAQRANRCHSSLGSRGRRAQRGGCVSAVPDVHAGASADAELAAALTRELEGEVAFDEYTRHLYARDASMYSIMPRGVVAPRHADDVAAAVALAAEHGVPVLPRGAGTSLAGQTVGAALVLDLSRHMSRILELDPAARTARVQPGVVQDQLNRAAAEHGLMFGPDTSTSNRATLGGMIGNNSAGSGSVRYGMTIDHVQRLDVVLSDASRAVFGPLTGEELLARAAAPTLD